MTVSVKSTLGAAPSVHMKPRWPPEPVNAQSCSSGEERCVTTLITAAKGLRLLIMPIFQKKGDCERS